jgi:hypothetical protein
VISRLGQCDEAHIAFEHDGLGCRRDPGEAKTGGEFAFVHHAFADKFRVLGVVDDERVEITRISEGAAHDLRIGDALGAIGECDSAGGLEQADLGHFLAAQPFGQRRHGLHVDNRRVARAAQDEIDERRVVDHR